MRQLVAFLDAISIRNTTHEWNRANLLCKLHRAEIAPLDEILGVNSEEQTTANDAEFEAHALKMLEERKRMASV